MIKIYTSRNTAEMEDEISSVQAGGRPLLGSGAGIDATVSENEGATAAKAPFLPHVRPDRTLDPAGFAAEAARASGADEDMMRLMINLFSEVIDNLAFEYGAVRIETPFGVVETNIAGTIASVTSQIDTEKNYAYLSYTPGDNLQKAVSTLPFYNASESEAPFKVETVREDGTNAEGPFQMGSDVLVRGSGFVDGATVKLVDVVTGVETAATVKSVRGSLLVVTIPTSLNVEHKHKVIVTQTIDDEEWPIESNKPIAVSPAPQPDHEILLVKHGDREDNEIAFDESRPVVCTVAHHNGAGYELKAEKPVKVVLDYENQRHVYAVLDTQTIVNATETTVSFMNDENDTEEVDGSFWNHDVELTLYFADGGSATKTVRFVQL